MREEKTKYYVIKEKAVPEVLLKVIEAKRLMDIRAYLSLPLTFFPYTLSSLL